MIQRRIFLKQSALLTTGMILKPSEIFKNEKIGLQLYTLRNEITKHVKGTLTKVAKLGYSDVETFGYNGKYFGLLADEFKRLLKSLKLTSSSGHYYPAGFFLTDGWEEKWKATVKDASAIGQSYVVVPWMEENYRKSKDTYTKLAVSLNKAAQHCKDKGLVLAYHNHDFEFDQIEGRSGYDVLLKETDPAIKFEMDIYWVRYAGKDPIQLMKQNPGRFPLWHVKDMDSTSKKFFTEIGNGVIDFKDIFANAKLSGMKHFFVEQDVSPGPPFASIEKSIGFLKKNILR